MCVIIVCCSILQAPGATPRGVTPAVERWVEAEDHLIMITIVNHLL